MKMDESTYSLRNYINILKDTRDNGEKTYDLHGCCDINIVIKNYEIVFQLLNRSIPDAISLCAKHEAVEAYDHLRCHYFLPEAEELVKLLARPHMKSLLVCHDIISNKQYEPFLAEVPYEVDEDDVAVKILHIVKDNEPLGATIKVNERSGAVLIARVMHGGAADRSGALVVGDEIQEINRLPIQGRDPMEVIKMLTNINGDIKLKLCTSFSTKSNTDQNMSHVKALFSYSPTLDQLIPCREAGIAFRRGDILRLVNTEDPHWWQAVKVDPIFGPGFKAMSNMDPDCLPGVMSGRTGLIPSRALQEKKEQYKFSLGQLEKENVSDILTYEEVDQYFAEDGNYRAIVIIGPPGVGKKELQRQLINTDPSHFKEPIKITTREPKSGEEHGQDFLFVTNEEFDTFARAESLIDQWQEGDEETNCGDSLTRSGLCIDAVLEIIQYGMVPVFITNPKSIPRIRTPALKPFIIYIKPPSLDILLETRPLATCNRTAINNQSNVQMINIRPAAYSSGRSTDISCSTPRLFSEPELTEMIEIGSRIEVVHSHYFDQVIINDDLPVALEQLSEIAYRLETEPFWVPRRWLEQESSTASSVTTDTKE